MEVVIQPEQMHDKYRFLLYRVCDLVTIINKSMSKKEQKAKEYALKIEAMDRDNGAPVNKAQSSMLIASYKAGWDEAVKEQLQDSGSVIIELDTVIEYKGGQVYIKKMNTSEMPATLTFNLIEALNNTIVEYYNNENKDETTEQKA